MPPPPTTINRLRRGGPGVEEQEEAKGGPGAKLSGRLRVEEHHRGPGFSQAYFPTEHKGSRQGDVPFHNH